MAVPDERDSANSGSQSGKVISIRGHQAAEHAIDELLATRRQDPRFISLVAKAFSIGLPLLSAIARRLDADRPQELLMLAEVAGRYPGRGQAVRTLVRAANDRRSTDARRFGAALALGLYDYGVVLPPLSDFIGGLASPASAFASAITRAMSCYFRSRAPQEWESLFSLFLSQPPEVLFSVIGALNADSDFGMGDTASVLRFIALNSHPEVTAAAVEALASRTDGESVRALAALQANLPPDVAHSVGRQLQKLRLSGIYDPDTHAGSVTTLEARLSAVDGKGRCLLRLATEPGQGTVRTRVLELILSDTQGVIDGALNPTAAAVNGAANGASPGAHHPLYGEQALHRESLTKVPFQYSLRVLRRFVRLNWTAGTNLPVAYILEVGAIWEASGDVGNDRTEIVPVAGGENAVSGEDESALLSHPSFAGWYLDSPATHLAAHDIAVSSGGLSSELTDENWRILLPSIIRLSHDEFVPDMRVLYANRLRLMAEWLHLSGQPSYASLAASAAYTMTHSPPEANLFVLRLVQKGILVALSQL